MVPELGKLQCTSLLSPDSCRKLKQHCVHKSQGYSPTGENSTGGGGGGGNGGAAGDGFGR